MLGAIVDWTDMFTGFTSIFTLAVISLERTVRHCVAFSTPSAELSSLCRCHRYPVDPLTDCGVNGNCFVTRNHTNHYVCNPFVRLYVYTNRFSLYCILCSLEERKVQANASSRSRGKRCKADNRSISCDMASSRVFNCGIEFLHFMSEHFTFCCLCNQATPIRELSS